MYRSIQLNAPSFVLLLSFSTRSSAQLQLHGVTPPPSPLPHQSLSVRDSCRGPVLSDARHTTQITNGAEIDVWLMVISIALTPDLRN